MSGRGGAGTDGSESWGCAVSCERKEALERGMGEAGAGAGSRAVGGGADWVFPVVLIV